MTNPPTDVLLVHMPYSALEHPSIGLSLLQAGLQAEKISSRVLYGNLEFARTIGLERYEFVGQTRTDLLLGEWIFSRAAFGDQAPDPRAYLDFLLPRLGPRLDCSREEAEASLLELQGLAEQFVDRWAEQVLSYAPRVVGCSSTFLQHCASLALLRRVKQRAPEVLTIIGGANVEAEMGLANLRQFAWLDAVFSGEADDGFPRFCRDYLERGDWPERLPHGLLRRTMPVARASLGKLDGLPHPCYDDYFCQLKSSGLNGVVPGLLLETSRGCWWGQKHHCTFCGLNGHGMNYRSKSPDRVLSELDALSQRYNLQSFEVVDNIMDMNHLKEALPRLAERGKPYRFFYETKTNLKPAQVETLVRGGVVWIQPGIESLHDGVLRLMEKGTTVAQNLSLLRSARQHGLRVSWNLLSGFPGEDPAWSCEMAELVPDIIHLQPPQGVIDIRYDRFSPYFYRAAEFGLELEPLPHYAHIYPQSPEELQELAYFFRDRKPPSIGPRHPERQRLVEQVALWSKAFWHQHLRPILSMRELDDSLEILDTRPGRRQRRTLLTGLARQVMLACEQPQSRQSLPEEADEVLEQLQQQGFLRLISGRYLNLAVPGTLPQLVGHEDFPGGSSRCARPSLRPLVPA